MGHSTVIRNLTGKDFNFSITTLASTAPGWALDSFFFEEGIRQKFWKVGKGDVVFDVGAGFGSYTLRSLALGASRVVAFEPDKEMLFDLMSNLAVNRFKGRCDVLPFMASERGMSEQEAGGYYPSTNSAVMKSDDVYEPRLLTSIDSTRKFFGIRRVDWIKVDVEGMEESVICGAGHTLRKYKPNVLVEYHEGYVKGIAKSVKSMMTSIGYKEQRAKGSGENDIWGFFARP